MAASGEHRTSFSEPSSEPGIVQAAALGGRHIERSRSRDETLNTSQPEVNAQEQLHSVQAQGQQRQKQRNMEDAGSVDGNVALGASSATENTSDQVRNSHAIASEATLYRLKTLDHILQDVSKMLCRTPMRFAGKFPRDSTKWTGEMKDRYSRVLCALESSKSKLTDMQRFFEERAQAGKPLKDEELRQYLARREQHSDFITVAHKWIEIFCEQQENLPGNYPPVGQIGMASSEAEPGSQDADAAQAANSKENQNKPQSTNESPRNLSSSVSNSVSSLRMAGTPPLCVDGSQEASAQKTPNSTNSADQPSIYDSELFIRDRNCEFSLTRHRASTMEACSRLSRVLEQTSLRRKLDG